MTGDNYQAASLLASSPRLDISWRRLGRIPCSPPSPSQQEMAMVQEKASALMDQTNLNLLMFHLQQYRERNITVEKLIQLLLSLFDTQVEIRFTPSNCLPACSLLQAQESLFTEIDELIFPEDLDIYNRMVFQKGQLFERFLLNQSQISSNSLHSIGFDFKTSPSFSFCYDDSTGSMRLIVSCI